MATVTAGTSETFTVEAGAQLFVTTDGSAVVESLVAPAGNAAIRRDVVGSTVVLGPWASGATFKVSAISGDARYADDVRYSPDGAAYSVEQPFAGDGRADGSVWRVVTA